MTDSFTFSKIWEHADMLTPENGGVFVRFDGMNRFKKLVGRKVEIRITAEDLELNHEEAIAEVRKIIAECRSDKNKTLVGAFIRIEELMKCVKDPCEACRSALPSYAHTCGAK